MNKLIVAVIVGFFLAGCDQEQMRLSQKENQAHKERMAKLKYDYDIELKRKQVEAERRKLVIENEQKMKEKKETYAFLLNFSPFVLIGLFVYFWSQYQAGIKHREIEKGENIAIKVKELEFARMENEKKGELFLTAIGSVPEQDRAALIEKLIDKNGLSDDSKLLS